MATLSRHKEDGGFYIRTGEGYHGTKQVHPDAVRYLNKHGVFVGDEIPTGIMSILRSKKGWLYTKGEHPYVVFFEFSDPHFGMRSVPRSAVSGTTRVVSWGSTGKGKRSASHGKPNSLTAKRPGAHVMKNAQQSTPPHPSAWSEPLPAGDVLLQTPSNPVLQSAQYAVAIDLSDSHLSGAHDHHHINSDIEVPDVDGELTSITSPQRRELSAGVPFWLIVVVLLLILTLAALLSSFWVLART